MQTDTLTLDDLAALYREATGCKPDEAARVLAAICRNWVESPEILPPLVQKLTLGVLPPAHVLIALDVIPYFGRVAGGAEMLVVAGMKALARADARPQGPERGH